MGLEEDIKSKKIESIRSAAAAIGYTLSTDEQVRNFTKAYELAKEEDIPAEIFLKVLNHEGSFKTDPGGNGGGIGQFTNETAQGYGYSQEFLRTHPDAAIRLSAKLLKDNADHLGGDMYKAAAAYFVGADIISTASKMPGDWLENADKVFAERYPEEFKKQGGPSAYVKNLGAGYVPSKFGTPAVGSTKPSVPLASNGELLPPNRADFTQPDGQGGFTTDEAGYQKAWNLYLDNQAKKSALQSGPLSKYVDDVINDVSAQIEAGKLDVSKASTVLTNRLNAFKSANDAYASDAFRYGAPVGATSVPGALPGQSIPISGGFTVNPLQQALDQVNQGTDMFSKMQRTPAVPSVQSIMAGYGGQYGGQAPSPFPVASGGGANMEGGYTQNAQPQAAGAVNPLQAALQQGMNQPPPPPPAPPSDNQVTNGPTSNTNAGDIAALARILAQQTEQLGVGN